MPIGPALRIDIPLDVKSFRPRPRRSSSLPAPAGEGEAVQVGATQCADGTVVPLPRDAAGTVLALPALLGLTPVDAIASSSSFYIRVVDRDEDRDPWRRYDRA